VKFLIFAILLSAGLVWPLAAQDTNNAEAGAGVELNPWVFRPSPALMNERAIPEISGAENSLDKDLDKNKKEEKDVEVIHTYTSLHHLGIVLGYSNTGVTKGLFQASEDTLLRGRVAEFVWGLGLLMDLGWSDDSLSSLRTRWSWGLGRLGIPQNIRDQNPADSLEESLSLFMLDFVMRSGFSEVDLGYPLWFGGGFSIHYAVDSTTAGSGSNRQSRLKNSTSLSPLIAIGSDIPFEEGHQLLVEADYLLWRGFKFHIGLRTRL
jgi:hypothetical protein